MLFRSSHHRISFADSKIRLALQNPIKHSGSEGVNHAEMSKSSARVEISRISVSRVGKKANTSLRESILKQL